MSRPGDGSRLVVSAGRGVDDCTGDVVEGGPGRGVAGGQGGDVGVGEQVGAGSAGRGVLGGGDEEFAGGVEGVGVPPGCEHALAEYEVDVTALPHSQAHPDVHL